MSTRRSLLSRPLVLVAMLGALVLGGAAPVAASVPSEVVNGQHGEYVVDDFSATPLVTCRYAHPSTNVYKLDRFVARPPRVWWPDTTSTPNQHGTVSWQVRIQTATGPGGPWSVAYAGPKVKRTAYEGAYDNAKKAPFTAQTIPWSKPGNMKLWRIVYKIVWYNGNGTFKGSVTHWIGYYKYGGKVSGASADYCENITAVV
ncbi:MAG: hypothetical protein U0869_22135 [Chloroflexota bacterium]